MHPALTAGSPPHSRVIQAIIKAHNYTYMYTRLSAERILTDSTCFSRACVQDLYVYVFSFNYALIDSTRAGDAALYTPGLAMISLQNINGHCRGRFEINHSALLLQTPDPLTHFSVPITLYCCVSVYEWFCIIYASYSLAVTVIRG